MHAKHLIEQVLNGENPKDVIDEVGSPTTESIDWQDAEEVDSEEKKFWKSVFKSSMPYDLSMLDDPQGAEEKLYNKVVKGLKDKKTDSGGGTMMTAGTYNGAKVLAVASMGHHTLFTDKPSKLK